MKYFIIAVLFCSNLFIGSTASIAWAEDNIRVSIDGEIQNFDQPPVIIDGRTLVPLRGIFELLGATIEWDSDTQTVYATRGLTEVVLTIGDKNAYINKALRKLDVVPQLVNNRTMVPARFVSEALGASVSWDETSNMVVIQRADGEMSTDGSQQENTDQRPDGSRYYTLNPDYTAQEEVVERLRGEVEVLGRQMRGIDVTDEYTQDIVIEYEEKYQEYYRNLRKLRSMKKYIEDILDE